MYFSHSYIVAIVKELKNINYKNNKKILQIICYIGILYLKNIYSYEFKHKMKGEHMKRMKKILSSLVTICLVAIIGATSLPITCLGAPPTIESQYDILTLGNNQLKVSDYRYDSSTVLGCFIAPETGKYSIRAVNNGSDYHYVSLLDENFELYADGSVDALKSYTFNTISLKKNEKVYVYIDIDRYSIKTDLLASKIIIKQENVSPSINKTAVSLKTGKNTTLKLNNNNKSVIWVSSNKSVATVSTKGVVTAKKKGTAYIYAIANHKLYKCKVSVY